MARAEIGVLQQSRDHLLESRNVLRLVTDVFDEWLQQAEMLRRGITRRAPTGSRIVVSEASRARLAVAAAVTR
jgi:hypothetical protein